MSVSHTDQPRKVRLKWIVIPAVVVTAALLAVIFFPSSTVKGALRSRLSEFLTARLGPGTTIDEIDADLHSVSLRGVSVPLGNSRSSLRIREISLSIVPLNLLRSPGQLERVAHRLKVIDPTLVIHQTPSDASNSSGDQPWMPELRFPSALYSILGRLDSLSSVELEHFRILLADSKHPPVLLCDVSGGIDRGPGGKFRLMMTGSYLAGAGRTLELAGTLSPIDKEAVFHLAADVPAGRIPYLEQIVPDVTTTGGTVALQLEAQLDSVRLNGNAQFGEVEIKSPVGLIQFGSVNAILSHDTLQLDSIPITSDVSTGWIGGFVLLRGQGKPNFHGELNVSDLSQLKSKLSGIPELSGALHAAFKVSGTLMDPSASIDLDADSITFQGAVVRDLDAELLVDRSRVEICRADLTSGNARASLQGDYRFQKSGDLRATGQVTLIRPMMLWGWTSLLSTVDLTVTGSLELPTLVGTLRDSSRAALCEITAHEADHAWKVDFVSAPGASSALVTYSEGRLSVSAENAHFPLAVLFRESESLLRPLAKLSLRFEGDGRAGVASWTTEMRADSNSILPRIARQVNFSGSYLRGDHSDLALSGRWTGVAGSGRPFDGRAEVFFSDQVLTVTHLYIDAVGQASGSYDLRRDEINAELEVTDLALTELPIDPALLQRIALGGTVSGLLRVHGTIDHPDWDATLAMIDGQAFGVPGYWMNFEANGTGGLMTVRAFELGRDVRKIVQAAGTVDAGRRTLAITAEVGSGRAEDFVLALTGRTGILSGELQLRGAVSGPLNAPDVDVELTLRDGELVDEIRVDELTAALRTDTDSSGERILRVQDFAFSKAGAYRFSGYAGFAPRSGGPLSAHLEGDGDFLDIVDQLDRSFRTFGSDATLQIDFGGTVDKPRLIQGEIHLANGRFSFPDATPGVVGTQLDIRVVAPGIVEVGDIVFRSDNEWVSIHARPGCIGEQGGLQPLVIPTPRVCLGVLEIRTASDGMPLHLPGLMKPEWTGMYSFGSDSKPLTLSAWGDNRILISGPVNARSTRVTFPFYTSNERGPSRPMRPVPRWLVQRLIEAQWDVSVAVGAGVHYNVEITGLKNSDLFSTLRKNSAVLETLADYFDHLSIDALLEPTTTTPLRLHGCIDDTTFHMIGRVTSSRGNVEYLDQTFSIDYVNGDFDETNPMPVLEGRAVTMGADSLGRNTPVYLTMYQIDRETDTRQKRGRLDRVTFVLEGDGGETPEQVLQLLGYDQNNASGKAEQVVASTFARAIGRQWLDPLERRLERWTLLDEITFSPGGGRSSLARQQRVRTVPDSLQPNSAIRFFTGSQVTVGKYLTRDLFVTYTGEVTEGQVQARDRMGMVHSWNLEYRINPLSRDLVLDLAVEYDEIERKRDESVSLKYTFALEP